MPTSSIFRENKCMAECSCQGKRIVFVGVNSHRTNGISDIMIRSLSELSREIMIQAKKI